MEKGEKLSKYVDKAEKAIDVINKNVQQVSLLWAFLLFLTAIVFYVNLVSYVMDTDSTLKKYYNEQNTCGSKLLEKYTVRFRMPYYHKERSKIFIIINGICLGLFGLGSILLIGKRDILWGIYLFFTVVAFALFILSQSHLKSSINELTEDDLYNQGNFKTIQERINKLLEQKFKTGYVVDGIQTTTTCPTTNILCNFPPKLQDKIEKSIRVDNDLIGENISTWIGRNAPADGNPEAGPNPSKMILSYMCLTPECDDLDLLFGNKTANDYSERNNINYIRTPDEKIDVDDTKGILTYFNKIYAPYLTFTIALSAVLFFAIFIVLKRNGKLVHLIALILTLYIVAYILGLYTV